VQPYTLQPDTQKAHRRSYASWLINKPRPPITCICQSEHRTTLITANHVSVQSVTRPQPRLSTHRPSWADLLPTLGLSQRVNCHGKVVATGARPKSRSLRPEPPEAVASLGGETIYHFNWKSWLIFLPFCHNSRVWQTDKRTDRRTDRILIARPRLHSMQRGKSRVRVQARRDLLYLANERLKLETLNLVYAGAKCHISVIK